MATNDAATLIEALRQLLATTAPAPATPDPAKRVCKKCGENLPLTAFRPHGRGGYRWDCRKCCNLRINRPRKKEYGAAVTMPTAVAKAAGPAIESSHSDSKPVAPLPITTAPIDAADLGVKTYVVVSDVHVPFHDRFCCDAVTRLCEDIQPTGMVIAGDFLDFYEISVHNAGSVANMEGRRVTDTYAAGNELLDAWTWATDFLDGNHEGRLLDWLRSGDNAAWLGDEAVTISHRLKFAERGITHHVGEYNSKRLGKLLVTHGRWTNKYHANKHLDEYRHSVVYGHTHSPQTITTSAHGSQQIAIGLGHLADPDSPAMNYAPTPNRWCQGFALVHVFPDETFRVVPLNFWKQSFVYGGKVYGRRPQVQVP